MPRPCLEAVTSMRTDDFDFDLPKEFIAQRPVQPRDAARLLKVRGDRLSDRAVRSLPELLRPGDLAVFNDTRVVPARLNGRRGEARIEVTLHKPADAQYPIWYAFARPAKRLRVGDRVDFDDTLSARVEDKPGNGEVLLRFDCAAEALADALDRLGAMPLPPYISRAEGPDPRDRSDYQTVFAREPGAVAAPTAGLHFTEGLLASLDERGVRRATLTLHVGAGTFLPVKTDDPRAHKIHTEAGVVGEQTARAMNEVREAGGRVVAIGTTALRLLEAAADDRGRIHPFAGECDIFILPGYRFKVVDVLMTNFHLPRSTLFMLVCAFAGTARMHAAYRHAIREGYRFYSYGDACLLHRDREDA